MGVSVVRGVGFGVSHDAADEGRPGFAKEQLVLVFARMVHASERPMPAYEFAFRDVNPPVHAWACWRVYKMTGARGQRDRTFLSRCFQN
jgi:hypothetical protein